MTNYDGGFDNENGNPIFQPELTGGDLSPQDAADWAAFCGAVVEAEEPLYNTWFENRWMRATEKIGGQGKTRAQSVVHATAKDGKIYIRCPTKIWAEMLRDQMSKLAGLSKRAFVVVGP